MKVKCYVIHDVKAAIFLAPFFMANDNLALRAFSDLVTSEEDNQFMKHPSDYTLFCIGDYDDNKGILEGSGPRPMGNGIEFVAMTQTASIKDWEKGDSLEAFEADVIDKRLELNGGDNENA